MPPGRRRSRLDRWLSVDLADRFAGRIVPIDDGIALACGNLLAEREAMGRPMNVMDAFIAATARSIGLDLVTRNEADFLGAVPGLVNPWS